MAKAVKRKERGEAKTRIGEPAEDVSLSEEALFDMEIPRWLKQCAVYRRVPTAVRARLDQALLLRPPKLASLSAIAGKLELSKYKISPAALKSYAQRLERLVKPAATSNLLAGVLGCLPDAHRRQLVAGGQVMLLSRVIHTISCENKVALSVAELAKLASILETFAKSQAKAGRGRKTEDRKSAADSAATIGDPRKLGEAIRMIYGLDWPLQEEKPPSE